MNGQMGEIGPIDAPENPLHDAITALDRAFAALQIVDVRRSAELRSVEIEVKVDGLRTLRATVAEMRARPEVVEVQVRRLEEGTATVVALVNG